jgi:two-component system phosphate regulon sensor histidine kinase PhoR
MPSVRSKITRAYIAVSLLVTLLLILPLGYFVERYFYDRLIAEMKTQTSVIALFLREHVNTSQKSERVYSTLESFVSTTGVRITLIDTVGKILFESSKPESLWATMENHAQRPEILEALERGIGHNIRPSGTVGVSMLYVARAVDPKNFRVLEFPGLRFIRVGVTYTEVDRQIAQIRWLVIGVGFIAVILIFATSRLISGRIARPIVEIAGIVRDIKAGDLDRRLPVRSNDEISRLAETINEMTEKLKEDIKQLQKLERFRSEFLGNVSHELRTPIFSLKGFLETLLDGALDDPSVNRQFLEKAYHHASRLDSLLKDLIEISRIESGDMKMSFRYFDVVDFLRLIRDDFEGEASKKRQQLLVETDKPGIKAFGDKERLRQALDSIVENAVKYSPENSKIVLGAKDSVSSVVISVSDHGPGIAPDHIPRIFERFYRVDKNRSREVGGTGLGLAIAKHIIEAHASQIHVDSTVGKGSTFFFELKK